jgi:hypothetical protein
MAPSPTQSTRININLPPVRKFSGDDGDPHGITDFIARIEKNTDHEFRDDEEEEESSHIATFRGFLRGDAKECWGMLSKDDKRSWSKVTAAYIKKFKTEREQRIVAKARSQMGSLKQTRDKNLKQYSE